MYTKALCICPPAFNASAMRTVGFWLRVVALVFAICAFAPIAEYAGWSSSGDYALFTGISAMLLALLWIVGMLLGQGFARGLIPLIVDSMWFVFWLACAAVLSKDLADVNKVDSYWGSFFGDDDVFGSSKGRLGCSVAFSWLAWLLVIVQIVVDVQDLKRAQGDLLPRSAAPAPAVAAKPAPTAVPGAIAMSAV